MTTFTYHHSSLPTFGFEKYNIRIYLHVLHVPSLLISPPFRVIWGSHRYVGMFFPILIQTSSVLATWIILPVIITPLCLALSNHTRHLKRRPLYQGLLYPGTMTTYTRQSFYAERQKENGRKQNGKLIFSYKKRRNHVTHLLNEAKRTFFTDFVEDNSSDQGRLLRATRTLLERMIAHCHFLIIMINLYLWMI